MVIKPKIKLVSQ